MDRHTVTLMVARLPESSPLSAESRRDERGTPESSLRTGKDPHLASTAVFRKGVSSELQKGCEGPLRSRVSHEFSDYPDLLIVAQALDDDWPQTHAVFRGSRLHASSSGPSNAFRAWHLLG